MTHHIHQLKKHGLLQVTRAEYFGNPHGQCSVVKAGRLELFDSHAVFHPLRSRENTLPHDFTTLSRHRNVSWKVRQEPIQCVQENTLWMMATAKGKQADQLSLAGSFTL